MLKQNKRKERASTLKYHTKKGHLSHVNHMSTLKTNALFCLYAMTKLQIIVLMPPQRLLTQDCEFIFRKGASQPQQYVSYIVCLLFCLDIMMLVLVCSDVRDTYILY